MKYRATIYKDGQYWTVEICKQKAVIMRHIAKTWNEAMNWGCFQLDVLINGLPLQRNTQCIMP